MKYSLAALAASVAFAVAPALAQDDNMPAFENGPVWDMATGRLTRQLPENAELRRACLPAGAVALSADGHIAALAGSDGTV